MISMFRTLFVTLLLCISFFAFGQYGEGFDQGTWQQKDSMIATLYQGGAYKVVEGLIEAAYEKEKNKSERTDEAMAVFSMWQGLKFLTQNQLDEAASYLSESIALFKSLPEGFYSDRFRDALLNQADLQGEQGQAEYQLNSLDEALTLMKAHEQSNPSDIHDILIQAIEIGITNGLIDRAEAYGRQALSHAQASFGNQSNQYFQALLTLGKVYQARDETRRASNLILQSNELAKQYLPMNDLSRIYYASNAVSVLKQLGRITDAESEYNQMIKFFESFPQHKDQNVYPALLDELGAFHEERGDLEKAQEHYNQANILFALRLESSDPTYIKSQINMGNIFRKQRKFTEAQVYYDDALKKIELLYGQKSWSEAVLRDHLASIYLEQKQYDRALQQQNMVLDIAQITWGPNHQAVATAMLETGKIHQLLDNSDSAKMHIEAAVDKLSQLYGSHNFDVYGARSTLASIYRTADPSKALSEYAKIVEFISYSVKNILPLYPVGDQQLFINDFRRTEGELQALVTENSSLAGGTEILHKLSLNLKEADHQPNLASMISFIKNPSSELSTNFNHWQQLRKKILESQTMTLAERKAQDIEVEQLAGRLRQIQSEILPTANMEDYSTVSEIATIKSRLPLGSTLVDFYPKMILEENQWTSSPDQYLVFITDKTHEDRLVQITLDKSVLEESKQNKQTSLYQQIWKPLLPYVKTNNIFVYPAGYLHNVSFNGLISEDGDFLIDHFDFSIISSAGDLQPSSRSKSLQQFLAVGNIDYYDLEIDTTHQNSRFSLSIPVDHIAASEYRSDHSLSQNPSSLQELQTVQQLLSKKKKGVNLLTNKSASKSQFVSSNKNANVDAVHLSVPHFYVSADSSFSSGDDDGTHIGLVFSGAQSAWDSDANETTVQDNGLLTSMELSSLSLEHIQLVVLSTTDFSVELSGTSMAILKNSLLNAGVEHALISLVQLPEKDRVTYFTLFYKNLLKYNDVKIAYKKTLLKLKKKYRPELWSNFVLI